MSTVRLYAVRDLKSESYGPIMCFNTNGLANRWFQDEANSPQSTIGRHPEDYSLLYLGVYDLSSADIRCVKPEHISNAIDLVSRQ